MKIKVRENRKGQSCKNIQSKATFKTPDEDEQFSAHLSQVCSKSKDCKAKYSLCSNKIKVPKHDSLNSLRSPKTTTKNKTVTTKTENMSNTV